MYLTAVKHEGKRHATIRQLAEQLHIIRPHTYQREFSWAQPLSEFGSAKRYVLFPDRQIVCLSFLIDLQIIVFYEETYDTR